MTNLLVPTHSLVLTWTNNNCLCVRHYCADVTDKTGVMRLLCVSMTLVEDQVSVKQPTVRCTSLLFLLSIYITNLSCPAYQSPCMLYLPLTDTPKPPTHPHYDTGPLLLRTKSKAPLYYLNKRTSVQQMWAASYFLRWKKLTRFLPLTLNLRRAHTHTS
jgi:hypothetical protein